MRLWLQFFCLTWIGSYSTKTFPEPKFDVMALGSSALFITWDPNFWASTTSEGTKFYFVWHLKDKPNETGLLPGRKSMPIALGQLIIPCLFENTTYKVKIILGIFRYDLEATTKLKTNFPPAKPDFSLMKWTKGEYMSVNWLPCGKKRNCQGLEPGTHFYVTYKSLESRNTIRINVTSDAVTIISITELLPGKTYEMFVTSVNGDFETNSDPQEIFTMPFTSPVQSVKATFKNRKKNATVIISWKPPRQAAEAILAYGVCYRPTMPYTIMWTGQDWLNQVINGMYCKETIDCCQLKLEAKRIQNDDNTSHKTLQRATNYTFFIIPESKAPTSKSEAPNTKYGFIHEFQYYIP